MPTTDSAGDRKPGALNRVRQSISPPVFIPASAIVIGLIVFAAAYSHAAEDAFTD